MNPSYLLALILVLPMVITVGCCGKDGQAERPEESVNMKEDATSPISIALNLKHVDRTEGVTMRVEMVNVSQSPFSVNVCPYMLMSPVKGSHILITQEGWGMGLVDICTAPRAYEGEEVFLPPNASFASDVKIPAGYFRKSQIKEGKPFSVRLLYETEEVEPALSNVVLAKWE